VDARGIAVASVPTSYYTHGEGAELRTQENEADGLQLTAVAGFKKKNGRKLDSFPPFLAAYAGELKVGLDAELH
jgi:hypothetical protein